MEKAVTIKDIADKLGVSKSTVSRILNGKNTRNKKLTAQVRRLAKRYNYQVNTIALGLRTNRTKLIGIIVPNINDDFFAAILSGIEHITEAEGYNLLICQTNESQQKEMKLMKSLIACNVEGILISTSRETTSKEFIDMVKAAGKKMVLFDRVLEQEDFPSVTFNDFDGAYKAGKHMISTGKKHFLYIGMSENLVNDNDRRAGYNAALAESGLPDCDAVYFENAREVREGFARTYSVRRYDAVACYHDMMAAEVLFTLKEMEVKVPDEVAVCGFDDRYICTLLSPSLTSVSHSALKLGESAANALLGLLRDEPVAMHFSFGGGLSIRESTFKK